MWGYRYGKATCLQRIGRLDEAMVELQYTSELHPSFSANADFAKLWDMMMVFIDQRNTEDAS